MKKIIKKVVKKTLKVIPGKKAGAMAMLKRGMAGKKA